MTNMLSRTACPPDLHGALLADPAAYGSLALIGYHAIGAGRIEMRRCPRCPSAITAPVADAVEVVA